MVVSRTDIYEVDTRVAKPCAIGDIFQNSGFTYLAGVNPHFYTGIVARLPDVPSWNVYVFGNGVWTPDNGVVYLENSSFSRLLIERNSEHIPGPIARVLQGLPVTHSDSFTRPRLTPNQEEFYSKIQSIFGSSEIKSNGRPTRLLS